MSGADEALPAPLAPTATPWDEATDEHWDVAIVGAGPAGALAAYLSARRGARTLLVDRARFPRWKVCGCCFNGLGLSVLRETGLGDLPLTLGAHRLSALELRTQSARARLKLPAGAALSREAFDTALVGRAVAAGAAWLPETTATVLDATTEGRSLLLERGPQRCTVEPRLVLVADGLSGQSLRQCAGFERQIDPAAPIGAGTVLAATDDYPPGAITMAYGQGGYVGLVRLEDGRLDVAAAMQRAAVRAQGGPATLAAAVLAEVGLPVPPDLLVSDWRGTPALSRGRAAAGERLFLLGDAVGYIEPFTGEGMAWAMLSAWLAAPLVEEALSGWTPALAQRWSAMHRQVLGPRQRVCRALSRVLKRPRLTRVLVALVGPLPWLARPWVHSINRPLGKNDSLTAAIGG